MTVDSFLINVFCSVAASFIFLFSVLILFKPKIRISPFMCKGKIEHGDQSEYYIFKIINISLYSAYDIHMQLYEIDRYPTVNGHMNNRYKPIGLKLNELTDIPGYRPSWIKKNAPYAVRVRTTMNLKEIIENDHKSIMLKVTLRHGLTGLVKVKTHEYVDLSQIREGKFGYGLKFG